MADLSPAELEPTPTLSETTLRFASASTHAFVERTAEILGLETPLVFGVRDGFHAVYGVEASEFPARPTTNDVFIASVGACLAGTLGGMLEARGIVLTAENSMVTVTGQIGPTVEDSRCHVIHRISVVVSVTGIEDLAQRATIERVCPLAHRACWLSQTLAGSRCEVTLDVQYVAE